MPAIDVLIATFVGMKTWILTLSFCLLCASTAIYAQSTFPMNGTVEKKVVSSLYINAHFHTAGESDFPNGQMLVQNGKILAIGEKIDAPQQCEIIDLGGAHVYPAFIDLESDYGMPEVKRRQWSREPHIERSEKGAFGWNEAIRPEFSAAEAFKINEEQANQLKQMGFGTVLTHHHDGIARGRSALITLGNQTNRNLLLSEGATHFSFSKGSSEQDYPSSLMGAIALLRQTFYDLDWYENTPDKNERNLSLEALGRSLDLPLIFDTREKLDILRADRIGDEFDMQFAFVGNGDEYQRIDEIKASEGMLIVPIDFPIAFDVRDPYLARMISLQELKHWELAPSNLARLEAAGVPFCITSKGCNSDTFFKHLRQAVSHGLSEEEAMKALCSRPAEFLNATSFVGDLSAGKEANFLVMSQNLFDDESELLEVWIQGEVERVQDRLLVDVRGEYNFNINGKLYPLSITGKQGKPKGKILVIDADSASVELNITQEQHQLSMNAKGDHFGLDGTLFFSGIVHAESRIWDGKVQFPDGSWKDWMAVKQSEFEAPQAKEGSTESQGEENMGELIYPFVAYGSPKRPELKTVLIKNATLWTNEEEGILEDAQLLMHLGKIAAVGKSINLNEVFGKNIPEIEVIDAKGKHVTPGIIDEHSHIAISRGVNEGTQASSAEVSIQHSVNSEDINIYRQLSGGVTCSQLLHGSANPIGGQSALIKLKWGASPEEMVMWDAAPFIKFALGENVKQSNWGDYQTERFPQTRMGVEQVFYDEFIRAREYGMAWENYDRELKTLSRKARRKGQVPAKPRTDLELEVLLQILHRERFITCHSYRQDEINMLMHVADSMGFTLNTFTHILEGYKVADKMREHGAGGSTFSDWWAYKFEVKDAIPYNGAILWEQGVVTAFNSDDAEMARRLNQEAGKAVKYGGVPEEEALKFVTLNPAKLLHLDDRMGSLKVGKDADIVIWSEHPMSIYAKAEKTFIEGICYWNAEEDQAKKDYIQKERARIIQKMLVSENGGGKRRTPSKHVHQHNHCDTILEEY